MQDLTIRVAVPDDLQLLDTHPRVSGVKREHETDLLRLGTLWLLAFSDSRLVGHTFLQWGGFRTPFFAEAAPGAVIVNALAVFPEAMQGHGIGTVILDRAEEIIRLGGYSTAGLGVYADNSQALAFYKKRGYALINAEPVIDDLNPSGTFAMTKTFT